MKSEASKIVYNTNLTINIVWLNVQIKQTKAQTLTKIQRFWYKETNTNILYVTNFFETNFKRRQSEKHFMWQT